MPTNEEIIQKSLQQTLSQDLVKVDEGDFIALKLAANQFINKVENISYQGQRIYSVLINGGSIKKGIAQFYQWMRSSQSFTRQALQLQHQFQEQLNNFLGRTIYLTYVKEDGSLLYLDDTKIGELYAQATKNVGRGNISASKVEQMTDTEKIQDELYKRLKASQELRAHVYKIAIARWQSNVNNELTKKYDPSKNTFYWRLYDNHHITGWTNPIATKGIIAQGYAGAVINEDPQVISSQLESSLKILYQNHIQKDSIGGAIKGDVVLNQNGQIQFAIKQGSFSTARFGQYLILAYNIQQIKQISKEEFMKYLPQLVKLNKITNAIIQNLNDNIEPQLNKEIKSVAPLI